MGPVIIKQTNPRTTSSRVANDQKHATTLEKLDPITHQNKEEQKIKIARTSLLSVIREGFVEYLRLISNPKESISDKWFTQR